MLDQQEGEGTLKHLGHFLLLVETDHLPKLQAVATFQTLLCRRTAEQHELVAPVRLSSPAVLVVAAFTRYTTDGGTGRQKPVESDPKTLSARCHVGLVSAALSRFHGHRGCALLCLVLVV